MSTRLRRVRRTSATERIEIEQALDALSAPELRAVVRGILDDVDEDVRTTLVDRLLAQATRGSSRWKPARPSPRIVADAQAFAEAARRVGQADPDDVTEHLRRASKAFLAGDHASARAVFDAIPPPVASVDIDLGQHELVEEVLGVDAQVCVAQYVASVYTTTPLPDRVDAVLRAIGDALSTASLKRMKAPRRG